mgnify:CR=1 FL=1
MVISIRIDFVFVLLSLNLFCLNSCSAENMGHYYRDVPHLFAYKHDDLLNYVKKAGYSDFSLDKVTRNSTGTILYLHNFYRSDKNTLILSVSARGNIKKILPPAKFVHLNDIGEFVAWTDDIKQGVHFRNGKFHSVIPIFGYFGVDPSGKFYFIGYSSGVKVLNNETVQTGPLKYFTEISSIDEPTKVLYSTNIRVENIFFKDNRIYLFARNVRNFKGLGDYEEHEIICQILKKADSMFVLEEEINIPRPKPSPSPFAVVDFDPWSDKVLLVDVKDMPFSFWTAWYLFDLKSKKMTKVGRAKDYGFFLQEDILKRYQ